MNRILVLNCGSSSVKYQLFDMDTEQALAKGEVERIGTHHATLKHRPLGKDEVVRVSEVLEHESALKTILSALTEPTPGVGVIRNLGEIIAVGHRVVHGGEAFAASVLVDDGVEKAIRDNIDLAPLHNPPNLMGIEATRSLLPSIPQVAVFDTAFHQTMPEHAYLYALPYLLYTKYRIRRYGFHGTSHQYVSERAAKVVGRPTAELRIVSCHLGNGASVAAVCRGRSIDTSMGFTPLEGLIMGTRSGDLDPAVVLYLLEKEELTKAEANALLNKHSGLTGISGISNDFRILLEEAEKGDRRAKLAVEMFCYRLKKYVGAYAAAMGGLDVLVFTAGIGENVPLVRKKVCDGGAWMGLELDQAPNEANLLEEPLNRPGAPVTILAIPTNEELVIARDTLALVESLAD